MGVVWDIFVRLGLLGVVYVLVFWLWGSSGKIYIFECVYLVCSGMDGVSSKDVFKAVRSWENSWYRHRKLLERMFPGAFMIAEPMVISGSYGGFGPKGFTDPIVKMLASRGVIEPFYDIYIGVVSAGELVEISGMLPEGWLRERHEDSPTFGEFVETARRHGDTFYTVFIVPKRRPDERVEVDGIIVPAEKEYVLGELTKGAVKTGEKIVVKGRQFLMAWWD
jgi:hypothetical protein